MPIPSFLPLLLLMVPGIFLGAFRLSGKIVSNRHIAILLTPGIGLAVWLLNMHASSLIMSSFTYGLIFSTIILGISGLTWFFISRSSPTFEDSKIELFSSEMWLSVTLSTAILTSLVLFCGWGYDQFLLTGHMSVTMQIQNDVYPPRFVQFPEFEYRYHYGVDTLFAALCKLFHLPVDVGIDIATIGSGFYIWLLLWTIGARMFASIGRLLLPCIFFLSGGTQPVLDVCTRVLGYPSSNNLITTMRDVRIGGGGLIFQHFFQPPFMLGFLLTFCIVLILLSRKNATINVWDYLVIGILIVTLSFSHIVLFAGTFGALFVELFVKAWKEQNKPAILRTLGMFIIIAGCAILLRGFFAPSYDPYAGFPLVMNKTIEDFRNLSINSFTWFGLVFPILGFVGLFYLKPIRSFWLVLLGFNLFILVVFRYPHSWDIVKFAVVSSMVLSFSAMATLHHLFKYGGRLRKLIIFIAIIFCVYSTICTILSSFYLETKRMPLPSHDDHRIMTWLGVHAKSGELVLGDRASSHKYSAWGGLNTTWDDYGTFYGIPHTVVEKRNRLLKILPLNIEPYWEEGIRWIVQRHGSQPDMTRHILQWTQNNQIEQVFNSEQAIVFKIHQPIVQKVDHFKQSSDEQYKNIISNIQSDSKDPGP